MNFHNVKTLDDAKAFIKEHAIDEKFTLEALSVLDVIHEKCKIKLKENPELEIKFSIHGVGMADNEVNISNYGYGFQFTVGSYLNGLAVVPDSNKKLSKIVLALSPLEW